MDSRTGSTDARGYTHWITRCFQKSPDHALSRDDQITLWKPPTPVHALESPDHALELPDHPNPVLDSRNHQIIPPDHAVETPLRLIYTSEPTSAADPATGYTKPGLAKSADQRIIEAGCVTFGIMKNSHISSSSFLLNSPLDAVAKIMHLQCSQTARALKILLPSLQNVKSAPGLLSTFSPRSPNWCMPRSRQH